jgi:hypothetical protein
MNTADKASPTSVPATPKREVRTVAEGEAIPTAIILGRSKIAWLCCSLKEDHSLRIKRHLCCGYWDNISSDSSNKSRNPSE